MRKESRWRSFWQSINCKMWRYQTVWQWDLPLSLFRAVHGKSGYTGGGILFCKIVEDNAFDIISMESFIIVAEGISKQYAIKYLQDRNYERVAKGVYLAPDAWQDDLYIISLQYKKIVYSHNTEIQDKQFAVKEYLNGKKNLPRLMEYAKMLHIEKKIKQYMEVLL